MLIYRSFGSVSEIFLRQLLSLCATRNLRCHRAVCRLCQTLSYSSPWSSNWRCQALEAFQLPLFPVGQCKMGLYTSATAPLLPAITWQHCLFHHRVPLSLLSGLSNSLLMIVHELLHSATYSSHWFSNSSCQWQCRCTYLLILFDTC